MSISELDRPRDTLGDAECIRIRGARVHNLKNIDLEIPRDRLVVITGPSGSGKSSLAFDLLYAEGQRQYIESLSTYARQFLHQMERPDVDLIEGLQPTISIDQRAGIRNPRSTVATVTEIHDHLRLLFARAGDVFCYRCGAPIRQQAPEQIVDELAALAEGTRLVLLAPLVRGRKGQHAEAFQAIRKAGFVRARVDGVIYELEALPKLALRRSHTVEAVVDRLVLRPNIRPRLAESLALALKHGGGLVAVALDPPDAHASPTRRRGAAESLDKQSWGEKLFSTEHACPECQLSYEELEPRTFSFNSPYGACPSCQGLGSQQAFDPELVLPELGLSLAAGAVQPWKSSTAAAQERRRRQVAEFAAARGFRWNTPLVRIQPKDREQLLYGNGGFEGLLAILEREYQAAPPAVRERWDAYRGEIACRQCGGARLRPEARSVRIGGSAIHEITALAVDDARRFMASLQFEPQQAPIAAPLVREISARLDFLDQVGLGYLTLDRPADTLSGGELQRIRLATGIGSALVGVCYILDEPSIGLHPRDTERLIQALRRLEAQGNSLLVVEHDEALMRSADHLIDMGPGAGSHGGCIVAQGTPEDICREPGSITGKYLSGERVIPVPDRRRPVSMKRAIVVEGATANNLKNVTAVFPLSAFIAVTGVSGSGKSSLVHETLSKALARRLAGSGPKPARHTSLRGAAQVDKLVEVDQAPIGRTPRSNPATYLGVFDEVRRVFATTRDARLRGYKAGRFSFNVKGGRCEACQGQGQQKIEMNFLPDLYVECPECNGARFNRATLEVRYRGLSISDVLDLPVEEAWSFFENFPIIRRLLGSLVEVGLGYLTLGQSSTTLSGGEAQRIKLAAELGRVETGKTLYILDEPTTGLHFDDIRLLLSVLTRLVDRGNSVIVIEHHPGVIKCADWVIDLGPEGGAAGGYVLASGTPEQIAALPDNATGRFLKGSGFKVQGSGLLASGTPEQIAARPDNAPGRFLKANLP